MVRLQHIDVTEKPWGRELLVARTDAYALKDIFLRQHTRSSLQSHKKKLETIYVIEGQLDLETSLPDGETIREHYHAGEAYTIPPGTRHRVTAVTDVRLVEVSTPELDDILRHQDDFGRAG